MKIRGKTVDVEASRAAHSAEREQMILALVRKHGFVTFRNLEREVEASPATLRRDLERLASEGRVARMHGAVKLIEKGPDAPGPPADLKGVPFHQNIARHPAAKRAIGRAAAALCQPGEGLMIDGGSTTLQMCPHLSGMHLQVFTNSLHIVSALLPLPDIRIQVPGGTLFREQNIILGSTGDELPPKFRAQQLFMGAAAVGPSGIMQADLVLVAAERHLIERADELILLVDSSKFDGPRDNVVCTLDDLDVVVTDPRLRKADRRMLEAAGIRVIIAE